MCCLQRAEVVNGAVVKLKGAVEEMQHGQPLDGALPSFRSSNPDDVDMNSGDHVVNALRFNHGA